jgi:hypothetical protein
MAHPGGCGVRPKHLRVVFPRSPGSSRAASGGLALSPSSCSGAVSLQFGGLFPVSSASTVSQFGAAPSLSGGVGSTVKQHRQSGQQTGGRTLGCV